jgi:hypothetical protein
MALFTTKSMLKNQAKPIWSLIANQCRKRRGGLSVSLLNQNGVSFRVFMVMGAGAFYSSRNSVFPEVYIWS